MPAALALLTGTSVFALAWAAHLLLWRFHQPRRQFTVLLLIFLLLPSLVYLLAAAAVAAGLGLPVGVNDFLFLLLALLWNLGMSLAYIMTYPPIQTGCPSLNIVLAVFRSRGDGISDRQLMALFTPEELLTDRIRDLTGDGFIELRGDAWGLNLSGRVVGTVFRSYRRLLGLPPGEG